jgi:hypothetical protein
MDRKFPPRRPIGVKPSVRSRSSVQASRPATVREMTYQAGWKTVKINADPHPHLEDGMRSDKLVDKFLRWAWYPAPWLPKQAVWPLLWSAPAVCFAATLAVVALLKY